MYNYPIAKAGGLGLVAKVGVSYVKASLEQVGDTPVCTGGSIVVPNIGVGMKYNLTEKFAVQALVEQTGNAPVGTGQIDKSPTVVSAGVTVRF